MWTAAAARLIIRFRLPLLIAILALTGVFAWKASEVALKSITTDTFPTDHEFVQTFLDFQHTFGGASTVVLMIEVEEGDIFDTPTLEKVRRVTKAVELLPAINNYQVLSLAQRKVRDIRVDDVEGFTTVPIMWPEVPQTPEAIEELITLLRGSPRYNGKIVSYDGKAALVVAGFFDDKLDPKVLHGKLMEIKAAEEDANTKIRLIGRPIVLGEILANSQQQVTIFIASIVAMILMLVVYFRDLRGVLVPVLTMVMSAAWGVGFLGFLGYNLDPLIMVVPFIISARALGHSAQLINRYLTEYDRWKDRKKAAEETFVGLWSPGFIGILADALAVLAVLLTPIPLMHKLAVLGGFWVMSIVVSDLIFNPIFLSYFPPPKKKDTGRGGLLERALGWIGRATTGGHVRAILVITGVMAVVGFLLARTLVIGDVHAGTPLLWPDSRYNVDTARIADKFGNTEMFNVIVEGESQDAIKSPAVLRNMEGLQRRLEMLPQVSASMSIADLLPGIISAIHGGDPKWELIPLDRRESGFFLSMIFSSAEPGDMGNFITVDSRYANITVYLHDHKGDTLREVAEVARAYVAAHPFPLERHAWADLSWTERLLVKARAELMKGWAIGVARARLAGQGITHEALVAAVQHYVDSLPFERAQFRLAGGMGGLLAAVNEVIVRTEFLVTFMAFFIVFLCCAIPYRSMVAGVYFLIPLVISNYLTFALMGALQMGLDVNSLPVVALGVGLGVDYGLYVVHRVEEELARTGDLRFAIIEALMTSGKAVVFTALTMIAGVIFWVWSFLRFQADMGLLLVFWMGMSATGGLVLLPTLLWLTKPKFLYRRAGRDRKTGELLKPATAATN